MKILKYDSPTEKKVQKIEALMNKLEISLDWNGRNFIIQSKDAEYRLVDTESPGHNGPMGFPRTFDNERLELME